MSKAIVKKTAICLRSTGGFSEFLMDSSKFISILAKL